MDYRFNLADGSDMKTNRTIYRFAILILLFVLSSSGFGADKKEDNKDKSKNVLPQVEIYNPEGMRVVYEVEVAKTYQQRAKGLMYRESLPENRGMFFVFNAMINHTMWMKDTKIPLDIIFIDDKFRVVGVAENTVPFSETTISVDAESLYALEVNAGQAQKKGIIIGSIVVLKGIELK